jgi:hypothetical protein
MTGRFEYLDELRAHLDALCDESCTPEQMQRIEELVLSHPEAEAFYVQYMSFHADIARHFGTMPGRTESPPCEQTTAVPVRTAQERRAPERVRRRMRRLMWGGLALASAAAAVLLFASFALRPNSEFETYVSFAPTEASNDDTVAVLLQAREAQWGDCDLPTRPGAALWPGWLRLKSGVAHIEFYSGATVILQGPAELKLVSRSEAYCARGKLRATVPPHAQGFKIGAPSLDLIDRGTEFGLDVGGANRTEVHVFQGKVELYDPAAGKATALRKELLTGQGVRLEGAGVLHPIAVSPGAFKTAQELGRQLQEDTSRRQREWLKASIGLRQDPSVLVYFPFQSEQPWNRTLADLALGHEEPRDGAIVGCSWVTGRWPGKQALEFKRVSDRVRVKLTGMHDALTMMAWVRVDALPNKFNSLFMTDSWEEFAPHWHISNQGTIELGVQGPGRKNGVHYYADAAISEDRLGQWLHLAVVFDRAGDRVTHYVDGQPVQQEAVKLDAPLRLMDGEIGNWNVGNRRHNHPTRYFSGAMDEFMIFGRALTDAEVERLWTHGRPPS